MVKVTIYIHGSEGDVSIDREVTEEENHLLTVIMAQFANARTDQYAPHFEVVNRDKYRKTCSCGEAWADEPGHDNDVENGHKPR
jgi:hypothetical protein